MTEREPPAAKAGGGAVTVAVDDGFDDDAGDWVAEWDVFSLNCFLNLNEKLKKKTISQLLKSVNGTCRTSIKRRKCPFSIRKLRRL